MRAPPPRTPMVSMAVAIPAAARVSRAKRRSAAPRARPAPAAARGRGRGRGRGVAAAAGPGVRIAVMPPPSPARRPEGRTGSGGAKRRRRPCPPARGSAPHPRPLSRGERGEVGPPEAPGEHLTPTPSLHRERGEAGNVRRPEAGGRRGRAVFSGFPHRQDGGGGQGGSGPEGAAAPAFAEGRIVRPLVRGPALPGGAGGEDVEAVDVADGEIGQGTEAGEAGADLDDDRDLARGHREAVRQVHGLLAATLLDEPGAVVGELRGRRRIAEAKVRGVGPEDLDRGSRGAGRLAEGGDHVHEGGGGAELVLPEELAELLQRVAVEGLAGGFRPARDVVRHGGRDAGGGGVRVDARVKVEAGIGDGEQGERAPEGELEPGRGAGLAGEGAKGAAGGGAERVEGEARRPWPARPPDAAPGPPLGAAPKGRNGMKGLVYRDHRIGQPSRGSGFGLAARHPDAVHLDEVFGGRVGGRVRVGVGQAGDGAG